MVKFVDCERDQAFLLPPDLRDWIPEDDLAHFVIEAVDRVPLRAFKVNHRGTGSAQYHPRIEVRIVPYRAELHIAYAIGVGGVFDIHGVANRLHVSLRVHRSVIRQSDVVYPLLQLTGTVLPAFDNLHAIQVGAVRILHCADEETGHFAFL